MVLGLQELPIGCDAGPGALLPNDLSSTGLGVPGVGVITVKATGDGDILNPEIYQMQWFLTQTQAKHGLFCHVLKRT